MKKSFFIISITMAILYTASLAWSAPDEKIKPDSRCAVCGMFVAKYPNWVVQIRHADGKIMVFDGVKDLMAYYFNPTGFGPYTKDQIKEIWVKDYYSLKWLDARKAFFVTGSDIHGPMGHEFIAFSSKPAAEAFREDHKGKKVLSFDEISSAMVNEMRTGQKMK